MGGGYEKKETSSANGCPVIDPSKIVGPCEMPKREYRQEVKINPFGSGNNIYPDASKEFFNGKNKREDINDLPVIGGSHGYFNADLVIYGCFGQYIFSKDKIKKYLKAMVDLNIKTFKHDKSGVEVKITDLTRILECYDKRGI